MKKKSLFLFLALVLALSLALSACNNNEANATELPTEETKAPEPEETDPPEPVSMFEDYDLSGVTIQLWHVYGEGDVHHETLLALVDEFNAIVSYP